jgi:hypothetical protein
MSPLALRGLDAWTTSRPRVDLSMALGAMEECANHVSRGPSGPGPDRRGRFPGPGR